MDGVPSANESTPYLMLLEPQTDMFEAEMQYVLGNDWYLMFSTHVLHPSTAEEGYLANFIEYNISNYDLKEPLSVTEGRPIRVFVVDAAWDGVVQRLLQRYPTNVQ